MTSGPVLAAGRRRAYFSRRPAQGDASPVEIFHVEIGWGYSLARDEEPIEFYLSEIIGAEAAVVVAHRAHPDGSADGSGLCQPRNRPHPGVGLCHRPVAVAVGQRLRELAAGGDVELGEDLSQVVLDGVRTEEKPGGDLRVGQA
jgi:hypothetical protein